MKELSIEQKAKRYDEAIRKLRGMMPNWGRLSYNGKTFLQDLVYIFPELKESEDENADEKVRKALIKLVTNHASMDLFIEYDIHLYEALSWLEKQGQVKESIISKHENKICKESNDSLTSEDERIRKDIVTYLKSILSNKKYGDKFIEDWIAWLEKQGKKGIKRNNGEIPNSAWSEEDENHVKSILSTIECCKAQFPNAQAVVEAYNADIEWLKSLRPQSQWRPSENELEVLRLVAEKDGVCLMKLYEQLKKLREE